MDTLRIKIEIGDRKFEADGPIDIVQLNFNAFLQMCGVGPVEPAIHNGKSAPGPPLPLDKIMGVRNKLVWLTVPLKSVVDAALVLLLGQREFRSNDFVGGTEIMGGLRASGQKRLRVDNLLGHESRRKYIIVSGKHRGRRYQLTEAGVQRAQEIARQLINSIRPPAIAPPAPVVPERVPKSP